MVNPVWYDPLNDSLIIIYARRDGRWTFEEVDGLIMSTGIAPLDRGWEFIGVMDDLGR